MTQTLTAFWKTSERLTGRVNDLQAEVHRLQGRMDQLDVDLERSNEIIQDSEQEAQHLADATDVLKAYAVLQERAIREKVERLVTAGLQSVFNRTDIEFCFRFELSRGQMTAIPMIRSRYGDKDVVETEATDARGGGILDVASFILRCIMLILLKPRLERVLLLDETFKHLSRDHLPRAAALVKELGDKLGLQIILVSHKDEFIDTADRIFDVTQVNGITRINQR